MACRLGSAAALAGGDPSEVEVERTGLVGDQPTFILPLATLQNIEGSPRQINRIFVANQCNGFKPPPARWKSTMEPPPRSMSSAAAGLSSTTVERPLITVAPCTAVAHSAASVIRTMHRDRDCMNRIIT